MRNLLAVEIFKLIRQSKTYYGLFAIFFIELLVVVAAYFQGNDILDLLLSNLKDSFYFEGNLLNGNLIIYLLLNMLWFHLPLILMILVAGTLTSEFKDGTLQSVMLQPISKWKFILSKYCVVILFTLITVLATAITCFGVAYFIFGHGDLVVYLGTLNFIESSSAQEKLIYAFLFGALSMVFFSVVSLTLAVILRESTKTWIVAALFLILNNVLMKFELNNNFYNHWFFPKLNNSWQLFFYTEVPTGLIVHNALVLVGYTVLFMLVGLMLFVKRDIG